MVEAFESALVNGGAGVAGSDSDGGTVRADLVSRASGFV